MQKENLRKSELYERALYGKERSSPVFYCVLALILLCALLFRTYWTDHFGCVRVDGPSMENTFVDGETLLLRYGTNAKRGDVIVVDVREYKDENSPKFDKVVNGFGDTDFLIKRLIAVEGDSVKCEGGVVYVRYAGTQEYVALKEDYIKNGSNSDFGEYFVEEGEIFFLGDNRVISLDSRYNEHSTPHIMDLYRVEDIYGVVPEWAIEHRKLLRFLPGF